MHDALCPNGRCSIAASVKVLPLRASAEAGAQNKKVAASGASIHLMMIEPRVLSGDGEEHDREMWQALGAGMPKPRQGWAILRQARDRACVGGPHWRRPVVTPRHLPWTARRVLAGMTAQT